MRNPFAIARQNRILLRAARTRCELYARHIEGSEEYLSTDVTPPPIRYEVDDALHKYENFIPVAVREKVLLSKRLSRAFYLENRKRRRTGLPRGPHIDDTDIVRDIERYMREFQVDPNKAHRLYAAALATAEHIAVETARARIRRAKRRHPIS